MPSALPRSRINSIPFSAVHALDLCLPEPLRQSLAELGGVERLAGAYEAAGPAWTLMADGWPLASGGVVRFWPGVGELWCWTGAEAGHWGVGFARHARACVEGLFTRHDFHRVQAHVREDDDTARRFAHFLGLSLEGRSPGYGPDQATHLLYGRFSGWKA
jgi:hypothetical protein